MNHRGLLLQGSNTHPRYAVSKARTSQMEYRSSFTRLEPEDVIATGTTGGVGARRSSPLWLKPGDIVEMEIDRLGVLRNGVADEI
jgi:2-keto-4-pentenoate hydratase/2-oxohepta-3-ene-1,7-dioic acid hydratase in catechol pathway